LWIHKTCADISDDVFDFLDKQKKETGVTYWACKPCTKYAQGMNHRMREIEEDLKEVKQNTKSNTEAIQNIEKKVEELVVEVKKNEGATMGEIEAMMRAERDEARERKDREMNVILHGAAECGEDVQGGEERIAWDKNECLKLFNKKNLRLRVEDLKFCRRVGPKTDRPRPLIIGFHNQGMRNTVLRMDLKTVAPDLSLGPDLTKRQREEEANIWKEMEERNEKRTADERSKNLAWRLVGPKGERRLILSGRRDEPGARARPGTGANTEPLGGGAQAGRGRDRARRGGTSGGAVQRPPRLLDPLRDDPPFRPRTGSKRGREDGRGEEGEEMEEDDETREPPTKH
jgi:hypothetical protein